MRRSKEGRRKVHPWHSQAQLAQIIRERDEALEQQAAISDVSPRNLQFAG